jgi:hypothetical protein
MSVVSSKIDSTNKKGNTMGSLQAQEMAEMLDSRTAMAWHLQGNHYPPIPAVMIDPCLEAIDAAIDGDWDREIQLPFDGERDGKPFQITWRGQDTAPAWAIVEGHHLQNWVELDEEYEDD